MIFNGNSVQTGVPLTYLQGQLDSVRGWSDGDRLEVHGALQLESVSLLGQQVTQLRESRILAVGDSLKTDIRGANANGIACALITGGVLKDKVGTPGDAGYRDKLQQLCAAEGVFPDYMTAAFNW